MSPNIAGIHIHKKLLVVVIVHRAAAGTPLQSRRFGTRASARRHLSAGLCQYGVTEAVMESSAPYGKPVWMELEPHRRRHLAQAQSNKAPKGRKSDLADAKRLVRRWVAGELMLSFIPDPEQGHWRMLTRGRLQVIRERVQLQNQIESLLEEGRIKWSAVVSDLLGASGRRILYGMSQGETNPGTLAGLGDPRLQCEREALVDALTGDMGELPRGLLAPHLERVEMVDRHIAELNQRAAARMRVWQKAITRLIEIPGMGVEAAQEMLAEIGPAAAAFPSAAPLASWIGVCPGSNESAGENHSGRCVKGNRFMRRLLCQAAQAAARTNGSHLQALFKRLVVRRGYVKAVWAIAPRLCKIIWNVLRKGARFIAFREARSPKAIQRAIKHHLKALRRLGYQIPSAAAPLQPSQA